MRDERTREEANLGKDAMSDDTGDKMLIKLGWVMLEETTRLLGGMI